MKLLYAFGLLLAISVNDIARINTLKQEAQTAYKAGDYETALSKYEELTNDMDVSTDEISLNMAHAYYHLQDTAKALRAYNELSSVAENKKIQSVAYNQVGVLYNEMDPSGKNDKAALNAFKAALKADPTNEEARYNYEVLKKKMKEKEQQDQQNQDQNQDQQDQENKENQEQNQDQKGDQNKEDQKSEENQEQNEDQQKEDQEKQEGEDQENKDQQGEQDDKQQKDGKEQEGEQKEGEEQKDPKEDAESESEEKEGEKNENDIPPSTADKLKELNISPQQAKMLLEAMKDQEVQYLQQLRRRPTKKRQSGKPDW